MTGPRVGLHERLERPVRQRVKDVEARLGRLTLTAAALDALTGDAWDTVDERLRFLMEKAAAWAGHEPQMTHFTLCAEGPARPCGPFRVIPYVADAHALVGRIPPPRWEMSGRQVGDDHGVVLQSGARKC
ncbi:hypothetical protein GCM10010269_36230 [Streptomyces humidus]|uniref:Uncharacterized protein n=1 Tax=Streptomyces humidus TaxID=52259 RepID=A0A918FW57_9ACTN|nr:hypothetical protein GCM10010269_36230 [Streptomyces humidus]